MGLQGLDRHSTAAAVWSSGCAVPIVAQPTLLSQARQVMRLNTKGVQTSSAQLWGLCADGQVDRVWEPEAAAVGGLLGLRGLPTLHR